MSVFDPQDFYSNALGREFFRSYYNPKAGNFLDLLGKYFRQRAAAAGRCPGF